MSFISSSSTLNIGDNNSTTVNINSANTLNLGENGGKVNIRGLDLLFDSFTSNFASFVANSNGGSATQCYYLLPYTSTTNVLVQWGFFPDESTQTITFNKPYNSTPYMYVTKYNNGSEGRMAVITNITSTACTIDSSQGSSDKASFLWFSIGLTNS